MQGGVHRVPARIVPEPASGYAARAPFAQVVCDPFRQGLAAQGARLEPLDNHDG